jgi:hypothetical protein
MELKEARSCMSLWQDRWYGIPFTASITVQRWNSWTAFLVEVPVLKLESSQTRVLVLVFPFYTMFFTNGHEFFVSRIFFICILKNQSRVWFSLKLRLERLCIVSSKRLHSFAKLMSKRIPSEDSCSPLIWILYTAKNQVISSPFSRRTFFSTKFHEGTLYFFSGSKFIKKVV